MMTQTPPVETLDSVVIADLKVDEGLRLKVYDDANGSPIVPGYKVVGHPTIGYGRALDTNGISDEEATYLLNSTVQNEIAYLSQTYSFFAGLNIARQSVLVNMSYQIGEAGLDGFHTMLHCVSIGDFDGAATAMLGSLWAREVPSRAQKYSDRMRSGIIA